MHPIKRLKTWFQWETVFYEELASAETQFANQGRLIQQKKEAIEFVVKLKVFFILMI